MGGGDLWLRSLKKWSSRVIPLAEFNNSVHHHLERESEPVHQSSVIYGGIKNYDIHKKSESPYASPGGVRKRKKLPADHPREPTGDNKDVHRSSASLANRLSALSEKPPSPPPPLLQKAASAALLIILFQEWHRRLPSPNRTRTSEFLYVSL